VLKRLLRRLYFSPAVNPLAARWHARLRPPPWRRPRMEFDFDVWNGISSLHARSGRQIGENNTGPDPYAEVIPTEHRVSNFEGSRQGLPVNMTALKHAMAVWRDVLPFAVLLRNRFIETRGLPAGTRFDLRQGYAFSKMAAALVAFQVRRASDPLPDHALPALETTYFTLGVGPFMIVRSLFENGDRAAMTPGPLSADELYELADGSGSLVTPAGKGCAGSRKLITEFLDVMMNGRYEGSMASSDAARAMAAIGDWAAFDRYLQSASRVELYVKIMRVVTALQLLRARTAGLLRIDEIARADDAISRSYRRTPRARHDDPTVLANGLETMLALVETLGDPALRDALSHAAALAPEAPATRTGIAAALRDTARLLAERCQRDMEVVASALEQRPGAAIDADVLLDRCSGPALRPLLASLETREKVPTGVRLRPFTLEQDLAELQRWVRLDYARFWGLTNAPPEKVARLYAEQLQREGYRTLVGEDIATGERCFVLEIYDPATDDLARHCRVRPGDLGFHLLLAPPERTRPGFTPRMLRAVHETLFEDPAVTRIVAEPDVRNLRIYRRLLPLGYSLGPVVQLRSKTSRLVFLERDAYRGDDPPDDPRPASLRWHRALGAAHILQRRVAYKLSRVTGRVA